MTNRSTLRREKRFVPRACCCSDSAEKHSVRGEMQQIAFNSASHKPVKEQHHQKGQNDAAMNPKLGLQNKLCEDLSLLEPFERENRGTKLSGSAELAVQTDRKYSPFTGCVGSEPAFAPLCCSERS